MDSKINLPSLQKQNRKGNSVIDEINRGKEYSKLLEQRQFAVPTNSIAASKIQITTKSNQVNQDDKGKAERIFVSAKPDQVGQIIDQTKPDPVVQVDKTKPGQIDQNTNTIADGGAAQIKCDTKPVELYQQLYPDVYVERTIVPEYQPNYD
ncbi:hypothetical protein HA402_006710 [Bradysia odoriphaga]|nr:hypothetical protein HA402_006710 [Bradysia odoriphaga]